MASAAHTTRRVTITPLDEKVAVLEDVPRESQYALKFVGAAIASKCSGLHEWTSLTHRLRRHGFLCYMQSDRHVSYMI